jgi:hypothetical protein
MKMGLSTGARIALYISAGLLVAGSGLWHISHGGTFKFPWPDFETQRDRAKHRHMVIERARELAYAEPYYDSDDHPLSSIHAKFRAARGGAVSLDSEELNQLRTILADPQSDWWQSAVILLALTGHREEASRAVQDFIRRREVTTDLPSHRQFWLFGEKAMATELLGVTATESDIKLLLDSLTLEGAKDLTKDWIDQIPVSQFLSPYQIYDLVQGRSGRGLAFAGDKESHRILERAYREYRQMVEAINYKTPLTDITAHQDSVFGQLADAMALRDFVKMMPREEAVYVTNSCGCFEDILRAFGEKYYFYPWLER